ncbi:MAG: hydrogenase formation protein HypD [Phycisphaerae bacterium]|nr:hydrogenase formation protein HypD [Phycisphaerae bacterium]
MKFVDEFRESSIVRKVADEIRACVDPSRRYSIMEVCGGHTHAIFRFGLADLLPPNIDLIHGPGCPVCVLPMGRIDEGLEIANDPNVILAAYGDMMRVPGSRGSPLESKARGADVRMVYSPLDALRLAESNPERRVVFFAIGFETTTPATALTLLRARERGISNFFVFSNHILVNPAIRALLEMPDMRIDAFIGPGHVTTVIGCESYRFIARDHHRPLVVAGFEPVDVLQSILMILRQLHEGRAEIENQYTRAVPWEGNPAARGAIDLVFEPRESFEWRGLGAIPASGLQLRDEFGAFDAERHFGVTRRAVADPAEARCGDVLKGALKPHECPLFGKGCTPERPIGALMVSSEGACAAQYNYAHLKTTLTVGASDRDVATPSVDR